MNRAARWWIGVLVTCTAVAGGQWVDFEVPWRSADDAPSLVDMSFLLDAPAGAAGFVRVENGHLMHPDGSRLRIWGVNLTGGACFPRREDAPAVAEHLARFGVNAARFHFLDSNWGREKTLFEWGTDSTRQLSAEQLDRLDFFVAELKQRGIYSNFNLNVGRNFREDDGVADWQHLGLAKAVTLFDPRIIELEKEYARQLLTHVNPYTKRAYVEEPALVIVELVNENSLVEAWFSGRLIGREPGPADGTWAGVTRHYAEQLDRRYNVWLRERLGDEDLKRLEQTAGVGSGEPIARLRPEQFDKADALRFAVEARFYMEMEDRFFQEMYTYLKDTLGVRALVAATSDHNHYRSGYPMLALASKLDIVDGHVYWQHPNYTRDAATGRRGFTIPNTPMVNDPLFSTPVQLSRSAVRGKPYTVSETNHPFPNEYACEGIPLLAAYALLHDWDGLFFYTFEHDAPSAWDTKTPGHFDIAHDPVKMANLAACALMFHRGDVTAARRTVMRSYSAEQVIESLRLSWRERPFFTPGFSPAIPLVHATRIASFDAGPTSYEPFTVPEVIASDTGQLQWRHAADQGHVTIQTDRTEALIGFVPAGDALRHLSATVDTPFCALVLSSLDGRPIARAEHLVLTATGRSRLTDMVWNENRTSLAHWGRRPMQIEPVRGQICLRGLADAKGLTIRAMDGAGRPLGPAVDAPRADGGWHVALDAPTVWYQITLRRL